MHVIIVKFGKESSSSIADCMNILSVSYEIVDPDSVEPEYMTHIILSGGPKHVYSSDMYKMPNWVVENDIPVLCICYGMQLLSYINGTKVARMDTLEKGHILVNELIGDNYVNRYRWMNRYDTVCRVPDGFQVTGYSVDKNNVASFTDNIKWWAVQYHPESEMNRDLEVFKLFFKK